MEDDVGRDGALRGLAAPPALQRFEENVVRPVDLLGGTAARRRRERLRDLQPLAARQLRAGEAPGRVSSASGCRPDMTSRPGRVRESVR